MTLGHPVVMIEWKIKQSVTLSDNYIMKTLLTAVTLLDKITGMHFLLFRAIPLKRGGGNQPNRHSWKLAYLGQGVIAQISSLQLQL